jgi:DNA topoisomerase II
MATKRRDASPARGGARPKAPRRAQDDEAARAYQWLSPQEAVLHRPDMFVGSLDPVEASGSLLSRDMKRYRASWSFSPIFLKIFDEALVNAVDAGQRDPELRRIDVSFSREDGAVRVENDGAGIPVAFFVKDGVATERYIPDVVFTELSAGSNFDDSLERLSGGRNGVGISCTNIWSSRFEVEVWDKSKSFRQTFLRNLTERGPQEVRSHGSRTGRVCVRFWPDYERLAIPLAACAELLEDLLRTRTAEAAVCARLGIAVSFNGAKLPNKLLAFAQELFGAEEGLLSEAFGQASGAGCDLVLGPRRRAGGGGCEAFTCFVNGVRCDGGSLAAHVLEKLHKAVCAVAAKQKLAVAVRPQAVREHLAVCCVARLDKPRFSSQSKEALSTPAKDFGFRVEFSERFLARLAKLAAVEELLAQEVQFELQKDLRKVAPSKRLGDVSVEKYDPALDCRKQGHLCTLILTEGDSAKALAVAGLSVVGRERFGVYPLRGKVLNVRNKPVKTAIANKEIAALLKILNVSPGGSIEHLRYGRVAIFTDQDSDGAHIAGLLLNVVHYFFPELLRRHPDFLCRIVTPLVRATPRRAAEPARGFYSLQEFNAWARGADLAQYQIKYYKGLGTSTVKDAKELFRDLRRSTLSFRWDPLADAKMVAFFCDKQADERKRILTEDYSPELSIDFGQPELRVSDFLQRDLIHYSMYSNFRGIASAVDGLTPSRRKVMHYFFSNKANPEIKVAQAAAGTAMKTMYLHGEASLVESIVGLAQEHVGTNNVALLLPLGQFGSRLDPPGTHAAARYIFSKVSNVARAIFPREDDEVLEYRQEEGETVEPKHFCGVVPLILVNGGSGIGTGFASCVPAHSLPSVVEACRALVEGREPLPAVRPHYEDFVGRVEATEKGVSTHGLFHRTGPSSVCVTELPVGRWTDSFINDLKEAGEKARYPVSAVVNRSTEARVCVELHFASPVEDVPDEALQRALKLEERICSTHMWLHDGDYKLRLFRSYEEILREHARVRLALYEKRKARQLQGLRRDLALADARAHFMRLVVSGELRLQGKKRAELEQDMAARGLPRLRLRDAGGEESFDYALHMQFASCTEEAIEKLRESCGKLRRDLEELEATSVAQLWTRELDALLQAHEEYLRQRADRNAQDAEPSATAGKERPRRAAAAGKKKAK